jgi:hypothetical protein
MRRRQRRKPAVFGESLKPLENRRAPMRSEKFRTIPLELSYDMIQSFIETGLRAMAKGKIKDSDDVLKIKLDYAGGHVSGDKIIPVEVIVQKGVRLVSFG